MKKKDSLEKRLADAGVVSFSDARDWLGFSNEEKALMDMQIAAERAVESEMKAKRVSQAELARRMGTKQPAVSRRPPSPSRRSGNHVFSRRTRGRGR